MGEGDGAASKKGRIMTWGHIKRKKVNIRVMRGAWESLLCLSVLSESKVRPTDRLPCAINPPRQSALEAERNRGT
jgi:hypothetical protein